MDELTGLLNELEAPPDAVWMRVVANALDPTATHADLADLVPDPGDLIPVDANPGEVFADELDPDDPDTEGDVWQDDLEVRPEESDSWHPDHDVIDPHGDAAATDDDADLS